MVTNVVTDVTIRSSAYHLGFASRHSGFLGTMVSLAAITSPKASRQPSVFQKVEAKFYRGKLVNYSEAENETSARRKFTGNSLTLVPLTKWFSDL